jgi:hypothetical protein
MENCQIHDAVKLCKDVLRKERKNNLDHNIWPSVNIVIDRMLERELELRAVYCELHCKLGSIPFGIWTVMDSVLGVAALWHPTAITEQRASRERLVELNKQIAERADQLAELIEQREAISNDSGFSSDSHYHIAAVMEEASENEALFNGWLKKPMDQLRTQFGLKYWPKICDIVRVLALDARRATVKASDTITDAATSARRSSKSDFVRALYVALAERTERDNDRLPTGFKLSDSSMASLVNCLLDLDPNEVVDSAYVKGFRQRARQADVVRHDANYLSTL